MLEKVRHSEHFRTGLKTVANLTTAAMLSFTPLEAVAQTPTHSSTPETTTVTPEVHNGREATVEEAAFSVYLTAGSRRCSGIILSDRVIATAYHCVVDDNDQPKDVSNMWVFSAGDPSGQAHAVKEMTRLGSSARVMQNDRVLLILEKPLQFSEKIQPIKLGVPDMLHQDEEFYVIGHGNWEEGRFTKHPRVGRQFMYYGWESHCRTEPGVVITQSPDGENAAVADHGDSGGGLFAMIPENHPLYDPGYYLLGITSRFCSPQQDENGNDIFNYQIGFQTIFFNNGIEKINEKIEEVAQLPAPPTYFFPSIKKDSAQEVRTQITLPLITKSHSLPQER